MTKKKYFQGDNAAPKPAKQKSSENVEYQKTKKS